MSNDKAGSICVIFAEDKLTIHEKINIRSMASRSMCSFFYYPYAYESIYAGKSTETQPYIDSLHGSWLHNRYTWKARKNKSKDTKFLAA